MSEPGRTVACPHCATRYFLPAALIGAAGARVRCPQCRGMFTVDPEGEAYADEVAPAQPAGPAQPADPGQNPAPAANELAGDVDRTAPAAPPPGSPEARPATPDALAAALLDSLAADRGEALAAAAREGRLFAAFGREILAAYDAYRREIGRDADPSPFRRALRERWGVEMAPEE